MSFNILNSSAGLFEIPIHAPFMNTFTFPYNSTGVKLCSSTICGLTYSYIGIVLD